MNQTKEGQSAYGKCTDCGKITEVDWDAGMCDKCAEKYAKEQEEK